MAYTARLRERAAGCEFGDNYEERILEHLIQTISDARLVQRAINERWTLTQFTMEAGQIEDISLQMKEMKEKTVTKVNNYKNSTERRPQRERRHEVRTSRHEVPKYEAHTPRYGAHAQKAREPRKQAYTYCGLSRKHPPGKNCPAYGKTCNKCGRRNHFASACRDPSERKTQQNKPQYVKKTTEDETSSEDDFLVKHLSRVLKIKKSGDKSKMVQVRIDDIDIFAEPDSGADVSIMDEH